MQDRTQYLIDEVCKLAGYITERDSKIDAQAKRIAALEKVVEAARGLELHLLPKKNPETYVKCFRPCDKTNAVVLALKDLDALGGAE